MRKLIFLFALISTFVLGQTPNGSRKAWTDTLRVSYNNQFIDILDLSRDSLHIVEDTTSLKVYPGKGEVLLRQLSSSNTNGGGMFVYADSAYLEGALAFDSPVAGKQWVRVEIHKGSKVYYPAWMGADATGANDVSTAITSLLSAMPESGGVIKFPAGKYKITSQITINKPVTLGGEGDSTLINVTSDVTAFFVQNTAKVTIKNLTFDCSYPTVTSGSAAVGIDSAQTVRLENLKIRKTGSSAIYFKDVNGLWITKCEIDSTKLAGIRANLSDVSNTNVFITENVLTNTQLGSSAGNAAIQTGGTTDSLAHTNFTISHNRISSPTIVGIGLDRIADSEISYNHVTGNGISGETIAFTGSGVKVIGNVCINAGGAGILNYGSTTNQVNNFFNSNVCISNAQGIAFVWGSNDLDFNTIVVTNNVLKENTYPLQSYLNSGGITGNTWQKVVIMNNVFLDNTNDNNFLQAASIVQYANVSDLGGASPLVPRMGTVNAPPSYYTISGEASVVDTSISLYSVNRESGNGAALELSLGFNTSLISQKRAFVRALSRASSANQVDMELGGWVAGKDTVIAKTIGGQGFASAGARYNEPHFILYKDNTNQYHLWVSADDSLRISKGAPSSDTDGIALGKAQ